jgi:hypothetical protein
VTLCMNDFQHDGTRYRVLVMLSAVILNVIMLSVVMLSVVMLSFAIYFLLC